MVPRQHAESRLRPLALPLPAAGVPVRAADPGNAARTRVDPEYEIGDTGVFDHGHWNVEVEYAKASLDAVVMTIAVRNDGPERAMVHVLPTLWFRNTWSWALGSQRPTLQAAGGAVIATHHELGVFEIESIPAAPSAPLRQRHQHRPPLR